MTKLTSILCLSKDNCRQDRGVRGTSHRGGRGGKTITEKELMGSLKSKSVIDLVKQIKKGNAYLNVHTYKYPKGEIRAQIK